MKEKYYTPELEEFHVGFEYEVQSIENAHWGKVICSSGFGAFDDDINDLEEERIRVKYLDKADIESLGFKFLKLTEVSFSKDKVTPLAQVYEKTDLNILMIYYYHSNRISIATRDPSLNDFYMQFNRDNFCYWVPGNKK